MPRGASDIPILRLEVLQGFMTSFQAAPNLLLMNLFPQSTSPSSTIKWESQRGGRGLTPFVAPGAPSPVTAPHGVAQHIAEAAFWKEKMPFDEEFLNNLRQPGTESTYQSAEQKLARELALLSNRSNRRLEWMFTQMLFNNGFNYSVKGGYKATIDYGIPADHRVTLGSSYTWDDGASKDILKDIRDAKIKINRDCGGMVDYALCNSTVLKYLAADSAMRDILKRQNFMVGDNNLYGGGLHSLIGVNPTVIASLIDIPNFIVYDEMYEIKAYLTAAVTGGSTTWITVDDATDFEINQMLRFWDVSTGTYEDTYIIQKVEQTDQLQLSAPPASSYKSGEDYVTMAKPFIPDDKFVMFSSRVDNQPIAEYKQAPFGFNRNYGEFTDRHEEWDPEVVWVRVQNKGIPILYNRDAIYTLDVKQTVAEAKTSTTTTTTSSTTTTTTS
jgi:hypothetical protein